MLNKTLLEQVGSCIWYFVIYIGDLIGVDLIYVKVAA